MGAKPFLKSAKIAIPKGEDGFWSIILELSAKGDFTARDIYARSDVSSGTISEYVGRLLKGGYIEPVGTRPHKLDWFAGAKTYRLVKPVELPPRLDRDGKERPETQYELCWRTMKMLRTFTAREIAEAIAAERKSVKVNTIRSYLNELDRVGVIGKADTGRRGLAGGGSTEMRYRLVRNLGARAPRILATKIVFDPNAGAIVGEGEAKEAGR